MTINNNIHNLSRIERHYMIETMMAFASEHGREMTAKEIAVVLEKMRAQRAQ